jgi:hypothetical protein
MQHLTSANLGEICSDPAVQAQLSHLDDARKAAVRRFWTFAVGGLAAAAGLVLLLSRFGWGEWGFVAAIVLLTIVLIAGWYRLGTLSEALKVPALETMARRAGLSFMEKGFSPPVYPEARQALFGSWLSSESFTDLFHGEEDGRHFAVYEAHLQKRSGRNTYTVFRGQMFAFQRRNPLAGTTVMVPDRSIFNIFKPMGGMERVKIESDAAFERKFEVYSTAPTEARQLFFDTALRQRLLTLRAGGKVLLYAGEGDVLVAVRGTNRFEPGSMLRSIPGQERIRRMLDDSCSAFETLDFLRSRLG